jgi:hypothetical protein
MPIRLESPGVVLVDKAKRTIGHHEETRRQRTTGGKGGTKAPSALWTSLERDGAKSPRAMVSTTCSSSCTASLVASYGTLSADQKPQEVWQRRQV